MENRKRDIYGDNYLDDYPLDDYPSYRDVAKFDQKLRLDLSAITYGAGLALAITLVSLLLGFLWAQAVEQITLNYSFLVDLTLAGSVLFGAFKGSSRAKELGLIHGVAIGLAYSFIGILILALVISINWLGALETILIAGFLGGLGGIAGANYAAGVASRKRIYKSRFEPKNHDDDYDDFISR